MSVYQKTKDYSIFKKHPNNRERQGAHVRNLINSIQACNMLEFNPILLDAEYRILDGQHRLEAAKHLDLEIYYQIKEDGTPQDMILVNACQKKWGTEDFINFYIGEGKLEYIKFKEYTVKKNLIVHQLLRMLPWDRSATFARIKNGTFAFPVGHEFDNLERAILYLKTCKETLERYALGDKKWIRAAKLQIALISLIGKEEFVLDTFIQKISLKAEALHKCADTFGYYAMLRDVYNYRNSKPIQ